VTETACDDFSHALRVLRGFRFLRALRVKLFLPFLNKDGFIRLFCRPQTVAAKGNAETMVKGCAAGVGLLLEVRI
jgi:hypothetical protein